MVLSIDQFIPYGTYRIIKARIQGGGIPELVGAFNILRSFKKYVQIKTKNQR